MDLILPLFIAILFSTYFSGMEIAFISSNKLRFEMEKEDNLTSRILSVFYRNPKRFISTMLVGSCTALAVYGICMAALLQEHIQTGSFSNPAALLIVQIIIATLVILFAGEFLPRLLFRINPKIALRIFAIPTCVFYILLYPVSRLASFLSSCMLRLTGTRIKKEDTDKAFTKVDLDDLIQSSIDNSPNQEEIDTEVKIFQNALDFSTIKTRDCMIPRTEIVSVDIEASIDELKETFIENGISKVIVYKENIDNVIGYIHSSEMFKGLTDWRKNIRSVPIVPESMSAHKLMKLFMQQKRSLAIVVDEFGGTAGIVALEDLVEEILGDIEDEHDINSTIAKQIGENEYILSGRLEIEKANNDLGLDLPENDEYQTVGGLILHEYQSFPKVNEIIAVGKFRFKIIRVTATKIELIKLKIEK